MMKSILFSLQMIADCDFNADKIPFHQYSPLSSAIYYPTTARFNKYEGIDFLPENKANYVAGSKFARKLSYPHTKSSDIMMHTCKVGHEDSNGGRVVQRVGPFESTGGYDWWQIGWTNVGLLKDILAHHPEGVDIINYIISPVDENGERIGHPPIHVHHVHVIPQPGVRTRNIMRGICVRSSGFALQTLDEIFMERNCYNSSLFFEQHGDYQCKDEDGGLDCLLGGDHNHRRITQALDVEGEINDVRPADSPPLKWYFQVAFEWKIVDQDDQPISQMTITAPGATTTFFDDDQLRRTTTFPTPTFAEHMLWYRGQMRTDGILVRNKLHAHSMIFESSVFFIGTPADLGLDDVKFRSKSGYTPIQTASLGFENNRQLSKYIIEHLRQSQDEYDRHCIDRANQHYILVEYHMLYKSMGPEEADSEHWQYDCDRPRPQLLCGGIFDMDYYDFGNSSFSYGFDRRPPTYCEPWQFKKGDSFVVVGMTKKVDRPTTPSNPHHIPEFIPGHISWHLWYKRPDYGHSAFARIILNQEGVFYSTSEVYNPLDVLTMASVITVYGGIPPDSSMLRLVKCLYISLFYLLLAATVWLMHFSRRKRIAERETLPTSIQG